MNKSSPGCQTCSWATIIPLLRIRPLCIILSDLVVLKIVLLKTILGVWWCAIALARLKKQGLHGFITFDNKFALFLCGFVFSMYFRL